MPAVREIYQTLMSGKQASVNGHLAELFGRMRSLSLFNGIRLVPSTRLIESGYVDMLSSTGLLYVLVYTSAVTVCIVRYAGLATAHWISLQARAIAAGAFCFLVAAFLGSANLPFQHMYPMGGPVALFMGLLSTQVILEFRAAELDAPNRKPILARARHLRLAGTARTVKGVS